MSSSSMRQIAARLGSLLCVSAVLLSAACGSKSATGAAGTGGVGGSGGAGSGGAGSGGAGAGAGAGTSGAAGASDAGAAGADAATEAPLADGPAVEVGAAGGDGGADRIEVGADAGDGGSDASDGGAGVVCVGERLVTTAEQFQDLMAEHCAEITGGLHVFQSSATPVTLSGVLAELTKIGGDLRVHSVTGLKSMAPFAHVESVGGALAIYTNDVLESLDGLEHLRTVGGPVQLNSTNIVLNSATGLSGLETVGGAFTIYAPVKSLQGWHLKSVAGNFFIAGTRLTSLAGLDHVTSVGGLFVGNNADLASLGPLPTWPKGAVKTFEIDNNPKLPQCQVDAFATAQGVACPACVDNSPTCN